MGRWLALGLLLCAACAGESRAPGAFAERNVVVIVMDTTRFDRLGFNGYEAARTPFLDGLAAEGVVFDSAISASSWTAPATASIFTSLYPDQHGVTSGYFFYQRMNEGDPSIKLNRLPAEVETLPEMLRAAGYRTYGLADNMNIGERMGFTRGFERFDTWAYEGGRLVNDTLLEWRDEIVGGEGPYFLYLQYMDPHKPYHTHDLPLEIATAGRRYDAELAYLDALLAEMFEALGLAENTLVVITADHGEEFGDHGGEGHDRGLYPELVHVPLVVLGRDAEGVPDWPAGRVAARVSTVDIGPTLRELLDRPAAPHSDGVSLVPLLTNAGARDELGDRAVFAHRRSEGIDANRAYDAMVQGPWQLIHQPENDRYQLFHLPSDPRAQDNLAPRERKLLRELATDLDAWAKRPRVVQPSFAGELELDAEQQAELDRLGYAE